MRHAGLALTLSVSLLAVAMILLAGLRGLVSAARRQQLPLPHPLPAGVATIPLSAVTATTESEHHIACGVATPAQAKTVNGLIRCHSADQHPLRYAMDDRTDDCAFRRDDVARSRPQFRKLRFPVTANTVGG
jgi:hypothetical protein